MAKTIVSVNQCDETDSRYELLGSQFFLYLLITGMTYSERSKAIFEQFEHGDALNLSAVEVEAPDLLKGLIKPDIFECSEIDALCDEWDLSILDVADPPAAEELPSRWPWKGRDGKEVAGIPAALK